MTESIECEIGRQVIENLRIRRPDPVANKLVITLDEMNVVANSIYTYESNCRWTPGGAPFFDFTDVDGNRYDCIVIIEPEE